MNRHVINQEPQNTKTSIFRINHFPALFKTGPELHWGTYMQALGGGRPRKTCVLFKNLYETFGFASKIHV